MTPAEVAQLPEPLRAGYQAALDQITAGCLAPGMAALPETELIHGPMVLWSILVPLVEVCCARRELPNPAVEQRK